MSDIVELEKTLELVNSYEKLAKDYGLFVKKVFSQKPGAAPEEYLVFSLSPIKEDVNPTAIINRNKRNVNIFYPENFAVALHGENPLLVWDKISTYLAYAEFVYDVYEQFETPLPKAIRIDELLALANFYSKASNPDFDEETRRDYLKGLREFFKNENPKSKFKKEWQEFYRSELFDPDKSFIQNLFVYFKRHEPETTLNTLIESSEDLKKVYMSEHHYKEFREIIKERYPGVKYHAGEVRVVDNGLILDPETNEPVETPYGITVTKEDYDEIIQERFAEEGFACIDGLTPSYFEGRDIIYKSSDENIIASVSHELAYRWAKCPDLEILKRKGPLASSDIPINHIMNFYQEMKQEGIPLYIDNDVNSHPNFETVRVVYNKVHELTVRNLLVGLALAQVNLAHYSFNNKEVMIDIDVHKVDALIQQAQARAIATGSHKALQGNGKPFVSGEDISMDS